MLKNHKFKLNFNNRKSSKKTTVEKQLTDKASCLNNYFLKLIQKNYKIFKRNLIFNF